MNLIEKQKEVNATCGFNTDNLNGLILGLISEIGELSSLIALKEGLKKPKPKDLEKFGGWSKHHSGDYIIDRSMFVECVNPHESGLRKYQVGPFPFDEAFNHERTQKAILKEITEELVNILTYLIELCIWQKHNFLEDGENTQDSLINRVFRMITFLGQIDLVDMSDINKIDLEIQGIANHYQIDFVKAYLNKCEKLLKRHTQAKTFAQDGGKQ